MSLEWKINDLWIGVYWSASAILERAGTSSVQMHHVLDIWICLLPTLPIHLRRTRE